jgi:hypothetical protein
MGKRGTMNHGMRLEIMIGQLMLMLANVHKLKKKGGGDWELRDFAIHLDELVQEELTLESALAKIKSIRAGGN